MPEKPVYTECLREEPAGVNGNGRRLVRKLMKGHAVTLGVRHPVFHWITQEDNNAQHPSGEFNENIAMPLGGLKDD